MKDKRKSIPRLVVVMDGGLVQDVYADQRIDVMVVDFDEEGGRLRKVPMVFDGKDKAFVKTMEALPDNKAVDEMFENDAEEEEEDDDDDAE